MRHQFLLIDTTIFMQNFREASILWDRGFAFIYFRCINWKIAEILVMKGSERVKIDLRHEDGLLTAYLSGELDHHTAAEMRERLDAAALSGRCRRLVLDFSGISFMDSSGVGLIMGRYRLVQSLGGQLTVQGASPRLERMIRLAGLDKLPIWDSEHTTERTDDRETHQ